MTTEPHQNSLTDPALELDAYIALDYIDDEWRKNVRFGTVWLPYTRLAAYLQRELGPCQYETARDRTEAGEDFDMRTLRDGDLVRIQHQFYNGFDIKQLLASDLEQGPEELLGEGAIVPHECPEPVTTTVHVIDEPEKDKKPFWQSDKSIVPLMASFGAALYTLLFGIMLLSDYVDDLYVWYSGLRTALTFELGLISLSWLIAEHLSAKRVYSIDETTPLRWKLTTSYCTIAALNSVVMMYVISKS